MIHNKYRIWSLPSFLAHGSPEPWNFQATRAIGASFGFPCGSAGKESAYNVGDPGSIPGLGRAAGEGVGYPLQYSGLENSMDCIVHGIAKSRTQLSDFHFHFVIMFGPLSSVT